MENRPFWSMNCCGRVLDDNFSGDFLKESLMAVEIDSPYRGPEIHRYGSFTYHSRVKGYECDFMAGLRELLELPGMRNVKPIFRAAIIFFEIDAPVEAFNQFQDRRDREGLYYIHEQ